MSQFWFYVETVIVDESRKSQTLGVPQQSWGFTLINYRLIAVVLTAFIALPCQAVARTPDLCFFPPGYFD